MRPSVVSPLKSLLAVVLFLARLESPAAESPCLYGIHDHDPDPSDYLNRIKAGTGGTGGWVTATVAVGANPNDFGGVSFTSLSNAGHTVVCRINYGYYPNGTIPVASQYDNFATRCKNFVASSPGCAIWLIGNETNLDVEWPFDASNNRFNYLSPQDYANCFRKVYNAIKSIRPNHKVIPQALAPWAGPYGAGTSANGYPHDGMPINWVQYKNQMLAAIAASGPLDGIAVHIGSRGYAYGDIHSTNKVNAGGQNLYFSFYVYKDWVDLGIPASLYHLPIYATECNGMFYWKGGHPENPAKHYEAGWMQEIYAEINRYNQTAINSGKPIYRCINMYRWCAFCDPWNIDGASNPYKGLILSDLDAAVAQRYLWPTNPPPTNPPSAPTGLNASVAPGAVNLSWTAAATATSYRVKRSTTSGGPYPVLASNVTGTAYSDTAIVVGTTYYYVVSAVNAVGESPNSSQVSATPTTGLPDLIVTAVNWTPTEPGPGTGVVFRATVMNQGSAATPSGVVHGVGFSVDGGLVSWHGSRTASIAAGASVTLTADGGPSGTHIWTATAGNHTVIAHVDDVNRITEGNEGNNTLGAAFTVISPGYFINCGGSAAGAFAADANFSGGTAFSVTDTIDLSAATNAAPQAVYQSERWGNSTYTLGSLLAGAGYTVRLHFAEISPSVNTTGDRRFHVSINGSQVLTNFDIFAAAGGKFRAITRTFAATANGSGQVILQFTKGASNEAKIGGIEVFPTAQTAPVLTPLQNLTVNEGSAVSFTAMAFDSEAGQVITDFESFASGTANGTVLFRQPSLSSTTSGFLDASPNLSSVTNTFPAGNASGRALNVQCSFKSTTNNPWLRLTTAAAANLPNPTIDFTRGIRFDIHTDKDLKVGVGARETNTGAEIGADGGNTGPIEFIGVASASGGTPNPLRTVKAGAWTTLQFNLPSEPLVAFTGNGVLESTTGKGVLEHLALVPAGGLGAYNLFLDNFAVVPGAIFSYSLSNAPAGASINATNGMFTWTPSEAQGPGSYNITVRVTKNGSPSLVDARTFTVTVNEVNQAPVLAAIPDMTVNAGATLSFTNTATDADIPANTLAFSLSNAPPGASIGAANGVFTWTAPQTATPLTNQVTVRVTDNGEPPLGDARTFTIVVVPPPRFSNIGIAGANVVLTWQTYPGKTYRVQYKNDLNEPAWLTLDSDLVAVGDMLSLTNNPGTNAQCYYRVVQLD